MTEDNDLLVVTDTDDPPAAVPRAVCRPTAVVLPVEGRWLLRTLVERLHLPPEQVLFVALERLYVQYPTGEMLDGGTVCEPEQRVARLQAALRTARTELIYQRCESAMTIIENALLVDGCLYDADGAFAAHARANVLALLDEIDRLQAMPNETATAPTCPACGEPMTRRNADCPLHGRVAHEEDAHDALQNT